MTGRNSTVGGSGKPARSWLLVAGAIAAILLTTLLPVSSGTPQTLGTCIICGERGLADALLNVALFVPLGIGCGMIGWSVRRSIVTAVLLSCLVEIAQVAIPGRDPSAGDLLFNTVGASAGLAIAALGPRLRHIPDRYAGWISLLGASMACVVFVLTGFLLAPSLPHTTYFGQWAPDLGHLEWYKARVLEATIAGVAAPYDRLDHSEMVRRDLLAGAPIAVSAIAAPRTRALGSLFSIYDEREREIILVGADREDLVYRYRTRGTAFRLDQPDIRLHNALRGVAPGDSLFVEVVGSARGYCMSANDIGTCNLGYTIGSGWGILFYLESIPWWLRAVFNMGWIAALAFPIGFWARRRWESGMAVLVLVVGTVLIPGATGLVAAPGPTLLGVTAGLGTGLAFQTSFRHRRPSGA